MKKSNLITILIVLLLGSCNKSDINKTTVDHDSMMVRIAEIEIEPESLDGYLTILKEEAEASVRLEPGVICIYPMYQNDNPNQIRLLEIYANKEAYQSHLQTPYFKHYKTATLPMVKSLRLIDMTAIDPETMSQIFSKISH
ncbi:putative quinol monooxygenase [Flagellimonas alvinocaridis]|nr:putative quinol monooxygenase [Allomuricauda alvinocaridis]